MGPRSRERGEIAAVSCASRKSMLQWGRARGSAERWLSSISSCVARFNGAALAERGERRVQRIFPHLLQWGRARGSAERSQMPGSAVACFNGAALAGARRDAAERAFVFSGTLQWGRARGSAERSSRIHGATTVPASMGPRSRERGESHQSHRRGDDLELQWGRARGSAERSADWSVSAIANELQWGRARGSAERS